MSYNVDSDGRFGRFGGAFVPELLYGNIAELQSKYLDILNDVSFQREFHLLLKNYVGRPTPLFHAKRLSESLGFPVLLKREDLCHTGAHKVNNAIGQTLLAKRLGKTRIIAETGAGQHGVATATACALLGLPCAVYMGAVDIERQSPNVERMRMLGADVVPVLSGSRTLKDATNEAMRDWIAHPDDTHYIIGSAVGPHPYPDMVARLQSVIGHETREQLAQYTSLGSLHAVVACVGGGSNAIGMFRAFLDDESVGIVGVEAEGEGIDTGRSAATLKLGTPGVLHGSATVVLQTSDGQVAETHSISAGLDYPGVGPEHAYLKSIGRVRYVGATDDAALAAATKLTRCEGILPALESSHALAWLETIERDRSSIVVVCLSGRGDKDLATYMRSMK